MHDLYPVLEQIFKDQIKVEMVSSRLQKSQGQTASAAGRHCLELASATLRNGT